MLVQAMTHAAMATVLTFVLLPSGAAAIAPKEGCDRAASEFDCYEAENGSITVDVGRTKDIETSVSAPPAPRSDFSLIQMNTAFCADAAADAAASGGASPEVAVLCSGFAAMPVAPGRA